MSVIRCKSCGGVLRPEDILGKSVCVCPYCNVTQTIAIATDKTVAELHSRANELRLNNRFDDAINAYEAIISKDPKDAEAYFCLLLCKYGIEYVIDPKNGERIPTCHRTQTSIIFDEPEYKKALEYADESARALYERLAKRIDEIMKENIRLSQQKEKYDVFICYKESDNDKRTRDSLIAQNIFDTLIDKGYRVFFARETLEGKLGKDYEPIIYAALRSARVLLLVSTSLDYVNSAFVKNEWSRYLKFMENDSDKYLIPCYRDFNPNLLPHELSRFQAQNLDVIAYEKDIAKGVEKLIGKRELGNDRVVKNAMFRAKLALSDGDFDSSLEFVEKALDRDPLLGRAYLYKALIDLRLTSVDEACLNPDGLEKNRNYLHARNDFMSPDISDDISKIDEAIKRRTLELENEKKENESERLRREKKEKEEAERRERIRLDRERELERLKEEEEALKKKREEDQASLASEYGKISIKTIDKNIERINAELSCLKNNEESKIKIKAGTDSKEFKASANKLLAKIQGGFSIPGVSIRNSLENEVGTSENFFKGVKKIPRPMDFFKREFTGIMLFLSDNDKMNIYKRAMEAYSMNNSYMAFKLFDKLGGYRDSYKYVTLLAEMNMNNIFIYAIFLLENDELLEATRVLDYLYRVPEARELKNIIIKSLQKGASNGSLVGKKYLFDLF